jgi:type I restriction enzyme M protein
VLEEYPVIKKKPETVVRSLLQKITKRPFHNLSKLDFPKLLDDPNQLAPNLNSYINKFSPNVRAIIERFGFDEHIARMSEKNLLCEVIKAFAKIDLSSSHIDNVQMGYVFEELIRVGAEQANEEAGEHFTPREVIKLMVNLLLSPEKDLTHSHVVKTIYDPACGTGGMLSVSEQYIHELNSEAKPMLYGQDWNDDAWAVCKSDMLIKGEDADNIILGDTFTKDGFPDEKFDYMLANPPFGVEWKQQQRFIEQERDTLGFQGRFGAGTPRVNDGSLLFLQHMLSKMREPKRGGSRIGIVFNGSPLFTGDAGSGESEIRRWIIENDWLEAIVALPDQLFYNTGISTYLWVLTNRKVKPRRGKIQLIDARNFWIPMKKSLGNKRHKIGDGAAGERDDIGEITRIYGNFTDGETRKLNVDGAVKELVVSKIFDNADFGCRKIPVERPLRLAFEITSEKLDALEHGTTAIAKIHKLPAETREYVVEQLRQKARPGILKNREAFDDWLKHALPCDQYVTKSLRILLRDAFSERDEAAEICTDLRGKPESDPDLRDTENVPLKEKIEDYFKREVLPHVPDAWIDESKTKIGYEIPLNRHFYRYEPPRSLEEIESDIKTLEREILLLLKEVTA